VGTLISSFGKHSEYSDLVGVNSAIEELSKAHKILRESAKPVLKDLCAVASDDSWGSSVKDLRVSLPANGCDRPVLLRKAKPDHNLAEVITLCATVERIIDALRWCGTYYPRHEISVCHPTSGSGKKGVQRENDLVMEERSDIALRFEITDNSTSANPMARIGKGLDSLGVFEDSDPKDRRFLVLRKPPVDCVPVWYSTFVRKGGCGCLVRECHDSGCSVLLEVVTDERQDGHTV
jgi:hypothetical protein